MPMAATPRRRRRPHDADAVLGSVPPRLTSRLVALVGSRSSRGAHRQDAAGLDVVARGAEHAVTSVCIFIA
jgi:hypothetical protein